MARPWSPMVHSPKRRNSWEATTSWIVKTSTKRWNGQPKFQLPVRAESVASRFAPFMRSATLRFSMDDLRAIIESIFRAESGRIIAGLIRVAHSFDLAEEAMQDAFTAAISAWPSKGVPENPAAWITTAAHRKLIDHLRREKTRRSSEDQLTYESEIRRAEN